MVQTSDTKLDLQARHLRLLMLLPLELKTGHRISAGKLMEIYEPLQWLFIVCPGHAYDLLCHCWNSEHFIPEHQKAQLEFINLMRSDGAIDEDVRQVVRSGLVPDDHNNPQYTLKLHWPTK